MKRTGEARLIHFFGGIPVRLHLRNDLHLARKMWHMLMGLIIVLCYVAGVNQSNAVIILGTLLALDLIMERTRLKSPAINDKIIRFWGPFMRAHEVRAISTVPHYLASVILAIAIFPKPVAVLSILYLACGDPMASVFGILYGHRGPRLNNGKTLVGTLAGLCVCALLTFFYLKTLPIPESTLMMLTVVGGLAGGMAELFPFDVDDNFTIPMVSGFALWLAFMVSGL